MKSKQEVIQQHYIDLLNADKFFKLKPYIDEDGWCTMFDENDNKVTLTFKELGLSQITVHSSTDVISNIGGTLWRPKTLQGIESNNGWITIKKKSELPEGNCWVRVYCESNIPDKPIDYISEKYKVNPVMLECVVQYHPIIKPEAPIY